MTNLIPLSEVQKKTGAKFGPYGTMESPSSLDKQSVCYSSYKAHTTMKALVGITANGVVSFASELYCGS